MRFTRLHLIMASLFLKSVSCAGDSLYDYFTRGGISSGLVATKREAFTLNGRDFRIFSGSLHYFRVHPAYWRDRLRKYRAAGLNAIDVYVPWNLHNPQKGVYDFGGGGRDLSSFLDLARFLEMAREEDLFVILRPGPYICAEWEFGGLPSWLLSEDSLVVRTSNRPFMRYAESYLSEVLSRVKHLQFHTRGGQHDGGPIIMMQLENEYASFKNGDRPMDVAYMEELKRIFLSNGVESLLFTSDNNMDAPGYLNGVLKTVNFGVGGAFKGKIEALRRQQPGRPVLVMEFWPGWFDHWFGACHHQVSLRDFERAMSEILSQNASVNLYMFHGGTNFGFMGGAAAEGPPIVTSYDYDAPITESGGLTPKYFSLRRMLERADPLGLGPAQLEAMAISNPVWFPRAEMREVLDYKSIIANVPSSHVVYSERPLAMERLPINGGSGQSYGFVVYRARMALKQWSVLAVRGQVRDIAQVIVDERVTVSGPVLKKSDLGRFGTWQNRNGFLMVDLARHGLTCDPDCTVDLFVENLGRANYGQREVFGRQKKGIWEGDVLLDKKPVRGWQIFALEFTSRWVSSLSGWRPHRGGGSAGSPLAPRLTRGAFQVGRPADTFLDVRASGWTRGVAYVNGFNVGMYNAAGPQKTMYVPGPLLRPGANEIILMDVYRSDDYAKFTAKPSYGTPCSKLKRKR